MSCNVYVNCDDAHESWESLFKRLLVEKEDGTLALRVTCCEPTPEPPPVLLALELTWDDIANADLLVGDASDVADWNTFFGFDTDPTLYTTQFTSVIVDGNIVKLYGGSGITLKEGLFDDAGGYGTHLLGFEDNINCVITLSNDVFGANVHLGCPNLLTVNFPAVTTAGNYCFYYCTSITAFNMPALISAGDGCFDGCEGSITFNLPLLTSINTYGFNYCTSATTFNVPSLLTVGTYCFQTCSAITSINLSLVATISEGCFYECTSLETLNISACTSLGGTVGNNDVFTSISGNTITLTCPASLMTCNAGSPDGDIQYLQANNTVTIINT